jgi:predicted ArsR family transcriptional regulator
VRVTPQQARILSLLADPSGFTEAEIASGTGILLEDVRTDLDHLKLQALVVEQKNRCYLRDDLRQIVSQSPDSTESSQS